jgi:hypothetical protein
MEFNIFDNNNIIKDFCDYYNITNRENYQSIFNQYFDIVGLYIVPYQKNIKENINIEDVKLNDYIKVKYLPYSQKYLNYYDSKKIQGKVIFKKNNNAILYYTKNNTLIFSTIEQEYCSYYGNTSGYYIYIYKK